MPLEPGDPDAPIRHATVSVITEFDGLLVKFRDGCYGEGQDSKANGTGMTTGAV